MHIKTVTHLHGFSP